VSGIFPEICAGPGSTYHKNHSWKEDPNAMLALPTENMPEFKQ
jgi:hypothetical protein